MSHILLAWLAIMSWASFASEDYVICKDQDSEIIRFEFSIPGMDGVTYRVKSNTYDEITFRIIGSPGLKQEDFKDPIKRAAAKLGRLNFVESTFFVWVEDKKAYEIGLILSDRYTAKKQKRDRPPQELKFAYLELFRDGVEAAKTIRLDKFYVKFSPSGDYSEKLLHSSLGFLESIDGTFKVRMHPSKAPKNGDLRGNVAKYVKPPFSNVFGVKYENGWFTFNILKYADGIRFTGASLSTVDSFSLLNVETGQEIISFGRFIDTKSFFSAIFENFDNVLLGRYFYIKAGGAVYRADFDKVEGNPNYLDVPISFVMAELETYDKNLAKSLKSRHGGETKRRSTKYYHRAGYLELMKNEISLFDMNEKIKVFCKNEDAFFRFTISTGCGSDPSYGDDGADAGVGLGAGNGEVVSEEDPQSVDEESSAAQVVDNLYSIHFNSRHAGTVLRDGIPAERQMLPENQDLDSFAKSFLVESFRPYYRVIQRGRLLLISAKPVDFYVNGSVLSGSNYPRVLVDMSLNVVNQPDYLMNLRDNVEMKERLLSNDFSELELDIGESSIAVMLTRDVRETYTIALDSDYQTDENLENLSQLATLQGWSATNDIYTFKTRVQNSLDISEDSFFAIRFLEGTQYILHPRRTPVSIRLRFFEKPFQINPGQLIPRHKPQDLIAVFLGHPIEIQELEDKLYEIRVEVDRGNDIERQLEELVVTDSNGQYNVEQFGNSVNQGIQYVDFLLGNQKNRILIIYYPLQYATSYRAKILNQKPDSVPERKFYSTIRYVDSQLLELIQKLREDRVYDQVFVRLAEDPKFFRQASSGFPGQYLNGNPSRYEPLDFNWTDSLYGIDYRNLIEGVTNSVDILYFHSFRNNANITNHFKSLLESARVCLVNFVDDRAQNRIDLDRLRLDNFYYHSIHVDDLLKEEETLNFEQLQNFFDLSEM